MGRKTICLWDNLTAVRDNYIHKYYRFLIISKYPRIKCLLIDAVKGHYANMLSTDSRLDYFARLQTPYINTTDMCLELYYELKSTAVVNKPAILVFAVDEEKQRTYLASSNGENRTSWDRMFAKLPAGLHQIVIEGHRSRTRYCGMSVDDVVVQRCDIFGEYIS